MTRRAWEKIYKVEIVCREDNPARNCTGCRHAIEDKKKHSGTYDCNLMLEDGVQVEDCYVYAEMRCDEYDTRNM
jgi:hypothetical protein